jgi:hypothetical protein
MVIFGGIHEVTKELDDMIIYDFKKASWHKLFNDHNDESPQPQVSPIKKQHTTHSPYVKDESPMKSTGLGLRKIPTMTK